MLSVLTIAQTLILVPIALAREGGPASGSLSTRRSPSS